MPSTTSNFDAALKEVYVGEVREQTNARIRVLNDFTKADTSQVDWEGRQAIVTLHSDRSNAVKAISETGKLPSAGNQGYAKLVIPVRFFEAVIELTTPVMKASRSNKGSFARAMDAEMKRIINDLSRHRNRALFGAGRGILALVNGASAGTTVTVDSPGSVAGATNGTRFLKKGMVIAFHDAAVPATIDAVRTISSVDSATTITISSAATVDDNAFITLGTTRGSVTEGSLDLEPMGLLGIADSTTFVSSIFGLDRSLAANAFFRSRVLASAGAWSQDLVNRLIDDTEEVSGELIDKMYAHYSLKREYLKTLEADRRYSTDAALRSPDGSPASAAGSKVDAKFAALPIAAEKDCPYGMLIGVNTSKLYWISEVEGEWMDEDGAILSRVSGSESFEATYRCWDNYFAEQGNALFRADGFTVTVSSGIFAD